MIWGALLGTALVSGIGATLLNLLFPDWRFIHYPIHAAVESVGAFAAFVVATLILGLRNHGHLGTSYTWVASALIGMGCLDGLHALHHAGTGFVWLHSVATFLGGMVFMGVWLADRMSHASAIHQIPKAVLILSILIGVFSVAFPAAIPDMVVDGRFSVWARVTNIVGGLGFLAASIYFAITTDRHENKQNRLVFSSHCFLFGLSGVIFEFSVIWDAAWWFWHLLRFGAYMIAVAFYFSLARSIEQEIYSLKGDLEETLVEQSASLKHESHLRQEAQASLRKIGLAIEQSPILVFITDVNGVIEYVNPKFEQITGYSMSEVVGQTPRILKSQDTPREAHQDMWKTILAGRTWFGELKDTVKDGNTFWASVIISPIHNDNGTITHFVAMHEDITVRKKAEKAMEQARLAAEEANKVKTDLMANMSHELRTPLNAIIGFSETIKDAIFGPIENPQYQEYGEYINTSGKHLLDLINDILDVSAVEAGKLVLHEEELNLTDICDATIRIVNTKAEDGGVQLSGISNTALPFFRGDARRMKQVFLNLLSNAIKFTPEHGAVSCDAYLDDDGRMVVTVSDTGIGMSPDGIDKALSKFGQVDSSLSRQHEGTGLGLPLTKGLVELHDGVLELSSQPGQGTKITMTFAPERVISPRL